jgi:hypothetical protein
VEERWWTAERVLWRKVHPIADEAGVVDEVAVLTVSTGTLLEKELDSLMCQHSSLGVPCAATRVL